MDWHNIPNVKRQRETRWSRLFTDDDGTFKHYESRFRDGTATITLDDLKDLWPNWNPEDRCDFCHALSGAKHVPEIQDILRYLVSQSDRFVRPRIASYVVRYLPLSEAISILKEWCQIGEVGQCACYYSALAKTKDSNTLSFLRICLQRTLSTEGFMAESDFHNWVAFDAVHCVQHMLELGEDSAVLRSVYETLKAHPDAGTRRHVQMFLDKYFQSSDG